MLFFPLFFRAHRTNDLTKKLEKVGPFECDELEKHCRVSVIKEKFNFVFLVLLLVSRKTKRQLPQPTPPTYPKKFGVGSNLLKNIRRLQPRLVEVCCPPVSQFR